MRRVAASGVAVFAVGCFNPDPNGVQASSQTNGQTASDTALTAGDTPGDTASAQCVECVPAAPEGWFGPLVRASGESVSACGAGYTGPQIDAFTDIEADPASCGCSCGDFDVDCGEVIVRYGVDACNGEFDQELTPFTDAQTCYDNAPPNTTTTRASARFVPNSGTEVCDASATQNVTPVNATAVRLCTGVFSQEQCAADEVCASAIPSGFDPVRCIAQEGTHACPAEYPVASAVFDALNDTRGCTACACSPGNDAACTTTLEVFTDNGCENEREDEVPTDTCADVWESFRFAEPTKVGTCTPSGGEAQGGVAGAEPITVCCLQ